MKALNYILETSDLCLSFSVEISYLPHNPSSTVSLRKVTAQAASYLDL